jgi:hypothetical protein
MLIHAEAMGGGVLVLRDYQSKIIDVFDRLVARGARSRSIGAQIITRQVELAIDRAVTRVVGPQPGLTLPHTHGPGRVANA